MIVMETKILFALLAAMLLVLGCVGNQPAQPSPQPGAQQPAVQPAQGDMIDPGVQLVPEIDNVTVDEGD
jgi:hypothetical protein